MRYFTFVRFVEYLRKLNMVNAQCATEAGQCQMVVVVV